MSVANEGKSVFLVKGEVSRLLVGWEDRNKKYDDSFFCKATRKIREDDDVFLLVFFLIVVPMTVALPVGGGLLSASLIETLTGNLALADILSFIFALSIGTVPTMLLVKIAILDDIYEDSIHQFTHVRLRDRIKHSLEKELSIHNGNELATHIHYALTETPYKDKMTAALYGFRKLKELEVKDEKQLEEANMQVLSLVIEVLKIVNAYKLEIKKAEELEEEQKRKELAEKELREKEEKDFILSQTLRNMELEFDSL